MRLKLARGLASATVLAAVGAGVAPPLPAQADQVWPVPSSRVFTIVGHGAGRGLGLSQWGAQGGALAGASAAAILEHYYPGTAMQVVPPVRPVSVLIQRVYDHETTVGMVAGTTLIDAGSNPPATLASPPAGTTLARVTRDGTGLRVAYDVAGAWQMLPQPFVGPLVAESPTVTRLYLPDGSSRDYRGSISAVPDGSTLSTVVTLPLESLLWSVVPSEMSSNWQPAALQAQAIAARSYAAYAMAHPYRPGIADLCDLDCQAFNGTTYYPPSRNPVTVEQPSTTAAVQATANEQLEYAGAPIFAAYGASDGGWMAAGPFPYLTASSDPWDATPGNPSSTWTDTLTVSYLETAFPAVGRMVDLRVTGRDGNGDFGGRIRQAILDGVDALGRPTSIPVTGAQIMQVNFLRSTWWTVTGVADQNTKLVTAAYVDLLDRQPDAGGLAFWSSALDLNAVDPSAFATRLVLSEERLSMLVQALYQSVLGRPADPGGLAVWVPALAGGAPYADVWAGLLASAEAQARAGSPASWVDAVYHSVLGRGADPSGRDFWSAAVPSMGAFSVAHAILGSGEAVTRRVAAQYTALLGRPVDADGLAVWTAVTVTRGDFVVTVGLISSAEYMARAQMRV